MGWLVTSIERITQTSSTTEVHVLPCDEMERPVLGHRPAITCFCLPQAFRQGPLDDPVWSHNEPSWPGAIEEKAN